MHARAETLTAIWSNDPAVQVIWLSGSVARGPVTSTSDLDLHIVVQGTTAIHIPSWRFSPADNIIENAHLVSRSEIEIGVAALDEPLAFAEWLWRTVLGDELQGAMCLFRRPDAETLKAEMLRLIRRRVDPDVITALSAKHSLVGRARAERALSQLVSGSLLDGQHTVRLAAQSILNAALVRQGWTLRASKSVPEIARLYADDSCVVAALDLVEESTGLKELTSEEAHRLCDARLAFRQVLLTEVRHLRDSYAPGSAIHARLVALELFMQTHDGGAANYYRPLVEAGVLKGPINHIRVLSGFAKTPHVMATCLGGPGLNPIAEWEFSPIAKSFCQQAWRDIAALTARPDEVTAWARAAVQLDKALRV